MQTVIEALNNHVWVPYYGPANLFPSATQEDKEWAARHNVWICEKCHLWIWSCKK
jgi:hypothetical protein